VNQSLRQPNKSPLSTFYLFSIWQKLIDLFLYTDMAISNYFSHILKIPGNNTSSFWRSAQKWFLRASKGFPSMIFASLQIYPSVVSRGFENYRSVLFKVCRPIQTWLFSHWLVVRMVLEKSYWKCAIDLKTYEYQIKTALHSKIDEKYSWINLKNFQKPFSDQAQKDRKKWVKHVIQRNMVHFI
jgi:hypothetical protein